MRRYRIALLLASLRSGGAERQLLALAERLPKDRFSVEFLSVIGAGPLDDRAEAAGIPIVYVGQEALHTRGVGRRAFGRISKAGQLARVVRRRRYDVVDAWFYPLDVVAALTRPLAGWPLVVAGFRNMDRGYAFGPVSPMVHTITARLMDAAVANSDEVARYAVERYGVDARKLRVIRNGVEPIVPMDPEDRLAVRSRMGARPEDVLVGCVANYREAKRHDLLLTAFERVVRERPEARLVLVGQGPLHQELEARTRELGLQERVLMYGPVEDVPAVIGAFDIIVQSSRTEGLPNALLEAAAAGRPIVATSAGGTSEIVRDGETGILVPVGDTDALASAISRAIQDPELLRAMGDAARVHVLTTFGMDRYISEFASFYEELIERHPRRRQA